jgi:hypothetical protein
MTSHIDGEILGLEERLTTATRTVDVDALDAIYADDIIFTGVTGVVCDKQSIMDEARRGLAERRAASTTPGAASVVSYDKHDLRAIRHGTTAVASFRFEIRFGIILILVLQFKEPAVQDMPIMVHDIVNFE